MCALEGDVPEIAEALEGCRASNAGSFDRLVSLLYRDLRAVAQRQLRRLRPGQTLDTTSLVNDAYLKMAGGSSEFADRAHFLAAAARAMRHILVNAARRKFTAKRGSGQRPGTFDEETLRKDQQHIEEVLAISHALDRLQDFDARMCAVVECRFYAGMTEEETGLALGVSDRTVRRDWLRARAWLKQELAVSG